MQAAWNKYGEEAFTFSVLVRCPAEQVLIYEQRMLDAMRPKFNTAQVAGNNFGIRRTAEQRENLKSRPQSTAKVYDFEGEQLPVPEIARRMGVTPAAIYTRLRAGGGVLPRTTNDFSKPVDVGGRKLTPKQIAKEFDLPLTTVYSRLRLGWTGTALTEPRRHRARNSRG